ISGMYTHKILDHAFFNQADVRFPSVKSAVEHLRRLGHPPPSKLVDLLHPPDSLWTAVDVFTALTSNMQGRHGQRASTTAASHVGKCWKSTIWPWLRFLLEAVVLSSAEASTRDLFEAFERILLIVPRLLSFNDQATRRSSLSAAKQATPDLLPLTAQVWCKIVDESHSTWGTWSALALDISFAEPIQSLKASAYKGQLYEVNASLGLCLIRHIHFLTARVPEMPTEQLTQLKLFMCCVRDPLFEDVSPLEFEDVRRSAAAALSSLSCAVISKQKSLREAGVESEECRSSHDAACMAASCLIDIMRDASGISEALKAGLVKAILKCHPCLFQYSERHHRPDTKTGLSWGLCQIIDRVSRAERRYLKDESLMNGLRFKSQAVWDCMVLAGSKSAACRAIRSTMREHDISFMCSNASCPLKTSEAAVIKFLQELNVGRIEPRATDVRFLRCSSCLDSTYCSRECRKIDWDSRHRGLCRQGRQGPQAPCSEHELNMFENFVSVYCSTPSSRSRMVQLAETFILDLSNQNPRDLSDDDRLVVNGKKNPIFLVDFNQIGLLTPEDTMQLFSVNDFRRHFQGKASPEWISQWVDVWRKPMIENCLGLVIAVFPAKFPDSLVVERVLEVYVGPSDDDVDDENGEGLGLD
ncbi:hypothetical protein V5O48_009676, partial [Marasmius crinis-equi]